MFPRLLALIGLRRAHASVEPFRLPPHPANVPGPFYVEDGCCISCGVWEDVAPDLLAWQEDGQSSHCYVARQPETDAEFGRMMAAMQVGEVDCIRVHNCQPDWARRLREAKLSHHIDPEDGPAKR
ncbi:ferredoxin [Sphingomonas sp. M1-B02]|uniref:ferredoxin n=1 Tax=Sphingomonas sp. M1-B02 TaxID=3114300 RepID=UPI00223EAE36|nr:ferredoxin [Sphingomonas sp. S6-11]UZK65512.1 ferredoxin [Sphingomonas sp. S6-11]